MVSCTQTCHDPVDHTSNSTLNTCTDGTTELTEDEGLGANNDDKSWNFSVLSLSELVSFERSDFEEQQENSGKQDEEEDGIFDYDSPSDDGDIPSLEREADFHLGRGSRFGRSIRFNSRIVFI